jgi:hypothetical protein
MYSCLLGAIRRVHPHHPATSLQRRVLSKFTTATRDRGCTCENNDYGRSAGKSISGKRTAQGSGVGVWCYYCSVCAMMHMWRFPIHPSIHPSINDGMYDHACTGWADVWFGDVCSPPILSGLGCVRAFYINTMNYYPTSDLPAVRLRWSITAPRGQQNGKLSLSSICS